MAIELINPFDLPSLDLPRDTVIANRINQVATFTETPLVTFPLLSNSRRRDDRLKDALNRAIDRLNALGDGELQRVGSLDFRDPKRDRIIVEKLNAAITVANQLMIPATSTPPVTPPSPPSVPPAAVTVVLSSPSPVTGGVGVTTPLTAVPSGTVADITFIIQSPGPEPLDPPIAVAPYVYNWNLDPAYTAAGTYEMIARARVFDGSLIDSNVVTIVVNQGAAPPPSGNPVDTVVVTIANSSLLVGQQSQATAVLRDSSGTILTGRVVTWASNATTIATVDANGLVTAVNVGSATITATSEGKNGSVALTVAANPTPPPQGGGAVAALLGPYPTSAAVLALGGVFAKYENDFVTYDEQQWVDAHPGGACGSTKPLWECLIQYDRVAIYYVWWQRTGLQKYYDRATELVLNFRQLYVEGSNYGIASDRLAEADGLALHWQLTGDTLSRLAVERMGEQVAYATTVTADYDMYNPTKLGHDTRAQSYAMKVLLAANAINAPSTGTNAYGWPAVPSWPNALRFALNRSLQTGADGRDPDGQWRSHKVGCSNGYQPFTNGLLMNAMIRYYETFEQDSRILPAIQTSIDETWANGWLVADQAFKYVVGTCENEGGPTPAADLNNLIVNAFAWVYKMTGDASYKTKADQIFAGCVNANSPSSGGKQFNQSYTSSYRYLAWR